MDQQILTPSQKLEDALALFKKTGRYNINLPDYLRKFSKNSPEPPKPSVKEKLIKKMLRLVGMEYSGYDIYVYRGARRGLGTLYRDIFFDAAYSFVLIKSGKAICSIGFNIDRDNNIIIVKQIQGVKGMQKELSPFRWEKMLLQILIDWAKQYSFKRIDVIRSVDSEWQNEANAQDLYIKYDVTARRMGFIYNKKLEVYSLHL